MTLPAHLRSQVIGLAKKGLPPRSIDRALSTPVGIYQIYRCLHAARQDDDTIPRFGPSRGRAQSPHSIRDPKVVTISGDVLARLQSAAELRGVSANDMVRSILAHVVNEGLVDAVLDDAGAR